MAKYSRLPKKKENERVSVPQSRLIDPSSFCDFCRLVALMLCDGALPGSCIWTRKFFCTSCVDLFTI